MTSSLIKNGQITLIIGPMFSGKSTELLRQLNIFARCYRTVFITHNKAQKFFVIIQLQIRHLMELIFLTYNVTVE